jgi:hypothetical protein
VMLCQAGRFGGWSFYLKDGKPTYTYNFLGLESFTVSADTAVPAGKATIRMKFAYDGGGAGKGGTATLLIDGKKVGEGRIERTQAAFFSADEGADVGEDGETPVANDYGIAAPYKFTGKIHKVTIDIKPVKTAETEQIYEALAAAVQKKAMSD